MPRRKTEPEEPFPKLKTAKTPQGRENQLISLADRLAEKQLREGTASAQVITHYLKLGSSREKLEQTRIKYENELTQKKIENMASANRLEELMETAISAFKSYGGNQSTETYEDYPEDPDLFRT
jgi:hypothetical protein